MGALALHLGSKLDASWRAAQSALGKTPVPLQQLPTSADAAEAGCDWVRGEGGLELPDIPDFPSNFRLPPLPQLLPTWQRLQSLAKQQQQPQQWQQQQQTPVWQALGLGASVGLGVGTMLALAVAYRSRRRCQLRIRK